MNLKLKSTSFYSSSINKKMLMYGTKLFLCCLYFKFCYFIQIRYHTFYILVTKIIPARKHLFFIYTHNLFHIKTYTSWVITVLTFINWLKKREKLGSYKGKYWVTLLCETNKKENKFVYFSPNSLLIFSSFCSFVSFKDVICFIGWLWPPNVWNVL